MRKSVLHHIEQALEEHPELRVGQLLVNVAGEDDLFYLSDRKLIERLNKLIVKGYAGLINE